MTELPEGPWEVPDFLNVPDSNEKIPTPAEVETTELAKAIFPERLGRVDGKTVKIWDVVPDDTRSSITGYAIAYYGADQGYYVVGRGVRGEIGLMRVNFIYDNFEKIGVGIRSISSAALTPKPRKKP